MVDVQGVLTVLGRAKDRLINFKWSKLVPRGKVTKYFFNEDEGTRWPWALGLDLTAPWGKTGLGLGIGLGRLDVWVGWPRTEEDLHSENCVHRLALVMVDN